MTVTEFILTSCVMGVRLAEIKIGDCSGYYECKESQQVLEGSKSKDEWQEQQQFEFEYLQYKKQWNKKFLQLFPL